MELLEKLAALVPPPRFYLLRYHGVLAPRARDRGRIVPTKPVEESTAADRASSAPPCGHRLRIIAALTDPASIRTYLEGVGLPAVPPPPPQFEFAA